MVDGYAVVEVAGLPVFVATLVALVVVSVRRPGEAGAWWPLVGALVLAFTSSLPAVLDDGIAGYAASMAMTVATYGLLAQTQLYLLRQRVDVHLLSAWVDRATVALVVATVGYAVLLGPLVAMSGQEWGSLVYATRPAATLTLLAFGVVGTVLSRGWGDPRSRAFLAGVVLLSVGDAVETVAVLARWESFPLHVAMVAARFGFWFLLIAAARRPAPTGARRDEDAPAVLLVPVAALATSVGALALDQVSPLPGPAVVAALAALVAVGVKVSVTFARITALNASRRQARTDELTGLGNRRALGAALTAVDGGGSAALALVDLDRFKAVNDELGHAAGDELLRRVAARTLAHCRPGDLVARQGGDEFALLLAASSADDAVAMAQRVAAALAEPFVLAAGEVGIGASIGVATTGPGCSTAVELQRRADRAMYRVKAAGGGVALYDGDLDGAERRAAPSPLPRTAPAVAPAVAPAAASTPPRAVPASPPAVPAVPCAAPPTSPTEGPQAAVPAPAVAQTDPPVPATTSSDRGA